jgi:hypothetical protein
MKTLQIAVILAALCICQSTDSQTPSDPNHNHFDGTWVGKLAGHAGDVEFTLIISESGTVERDMSRLGASEPRHATNDGQNMVWQWGIDNKETVRFHPRPDGKTAFVASKGPRIQGGPAYRSSSIFTRVASPSTEIGRTMPPSDIQKRRDALSDMGLTDISQVFAVPPDLIGRIEIIAANPTNETDPQRLPKSHTIGSISADTVTFADAQETISDRIHSVFTAKKDGLNYVVLGTDQGAVFIFWDVRNVDSPIFTGARYGLLVLAKNMTFKAVMK